MTSPSSDIDPDSPSGMLRERIEIRQSRGFANESVVPAPATAKQTASIWSTFFSTFSTIFLAEMGDKTQLATLLLSAQSESPWIVFLGAGLALIATSLVGVLLGRYLAKVLSPQTLNIAAGMLLMVVAVLLLGDVLEL